MIKAFDVVKTVIESAVEESGGAHVVDAEKLDILSSYCDVIDNIIKECYGDQITADIVDRNLILIGINLSSFVYETKFKPRSYVALIERAVEINFKAVNGDTLYMEFLFPSVFAE